MFLKLPLKDKVKIHPTSTNNEKAIRDILSLKHIGKETNEDSIVISITEVHKSKSLEIIDGFYIADTIFNAIVFRFFVGEILEVKIVKQEENEIIVALPFYKRIIVSCLNFPKTCEKKFIMPSGGSRKCVIWYWLYNDRKYYFRNNEMVRVKITKVENAPLKVYGSFDEQGLGPIEWWD